MVSEDRLSHWRRLAELDGRAGAPVGQALTEACEAIEKLQQEVRHERMLSRMAQQHAMRRDADQAAAEAAQARAEARYAGLNAHHLGAVADHRVELNAVTTSTEKAEAERDAVVAAVRTAHITHIKATHPDRMHVADCSGCIALVGLSRELPGKPDDLDALRTRLAEYDGRCPRCEGSMVEPGTEEEGDWVSGAMRHLPYSGEPCTGCGGTGQVAQGRSPSPGSSKEDT